MINNFVVLTMIAGLMNGSYAFPIKYMKLWQEENIWLVFSPIAFLLMPWLCLPIIEPKIIQLIFTMPLSVLSVLLISGFSFGIGMIVFTCSLRYVGLGISFVLNISSSTVLATLLPILWMNPKKLFSWFGVAEISALVFFCLAVVASYFASRYKLSKNAVEQNGYAKNFRRGIVLGIISGVLTSAQGFSYAYSTTILKNQMSSYSAIALMNAPWIPIFTAAFLPYFFYFFMKCLQNKSFNKILKERTISYFPTCLIMGILYFGSLIVFSYATMSLGQMGAVIAWPMLMIFIILTSSLWSFIHLEWKYASNAAFGYLAVSLTAFVIAIIALSIAPALV